MARKSKKASTIPRRLAAPAGGADGPRLLLPLFFMITGSLRKAGLPPPTTPEPIPDPTFDNYPRAFDKVDIPWYTLNSLYVVAVAVPLTVLVASWAGFAMTRVSRRAAGFLIAASLVALWS